MVATFFFASTPHDFIHDELLSHKDTVDHYHKHAGVSKIHIHCDFLRISLSPTIPGQLVIHYISAAEYNILFVYPAVSITSYFTHYYYLRGPPSSC